MATSDDPRRRIPRTDELLARFADEVGALGRDAVKRAIVSAQADVRAGTISPDGIDAAIALRLPESATTLRAILNATGVVVHTNLGRAPLSTAARDAPTAAPRASAKGSTTLPKFSSEPTPRPPETTIFASVSSGRSPPSIGLAEVIFAAPSAFPAYAQTVQPARNAAANPTASWSPRASSPKAWMRAIRPTVPVRTTAPHQSREPRVTEVTRGSGETKRVSSGRPRSGRTGSRSRLPRRGAP